MNKAIISVNSGKGFTKYSRIDEKQENFVKGEFFTRYTVSDGSKDVLLGSETNRVIYNVCIPMSLNIV